MTCDVEPAQHSDYIEAMRAGTVCAVSRSKRGIVASKQKKGAKGSKKRKQASQAETGSVAEATSEFLTVVEGTGKGLAEDVRQLFESLTERVSQTVDAAARTTAVVSEKVTKEPADALRHLLQDVKEVGANSVREIGASFDSLRQQVASVAGGASEGVAESKGKTTTKRKASAKKKATTEGASGRKPSARKAASKKKAGTKKSKRKIT